MLARGQMTQTLNNTRQLYTATFQWTLDNQTTRESSVRWTCSNTIPLTFEQWRNGLVSGDYMKEADMTKLLSHTKNTKEERFWFDKKIVKTENIISVFAAAEADAPDTLLFATKNWHGISVTNLSGELFDDKGFIVFRKGGDGAILSPQQSTAANLIGSGGMHNDLPLK